MYTIEVRGVSKFNKDIEALFTDIEKDVSNAKRVEYRRAVGVTRKGMLDAKIAVLNTPTYESIKQELYAQGAIVSASPNQVTGNLVRDYYMELLDKKPNEVIHRLSFKDIARQRPTLRSMNKKAKSPTADLEYVTATSYSVAEAMFNYGTHRGAGDSNPYDLLGQAAAVYHRDYIRAVMRIVDKAFKSHSNRR